MSQDTGTLQKEEKKIPSAKPVILALIAVFLVYAALLAVGLPQKWASPQKSHSVAASQTDTAAAPVAEQSEHTGHGEIVPPPIWMIAPFCLLLLCIAILPLIPATEHWWESNLHRFLVAVVLSAITLAYYAFLFPHGVEVEWPSAHFIGADAGSFSKAAGIFTNAIIADYIPFIVLLFALFTISGGIRISGDLKASPVVNSTILFIGAFLASFIGTTGAAMLLIRLLLETNKERKFKVHTVVFFIFCVCNCGGCLLPIGDPPLFLGYLKGVKFLWTFNLWKEWLFINGFVVVVYFMLDSLWYYRRESKEDLQADNTERKPLKFEGLFPNLFCLVGVILACAFLAPGKEIAGFTPWMFLREMVQLLMVFLSLALGSKIVRSANKFNYSAILEVAALFFGIFICMQAPLQILKVNGGAIAEKVNAVGQKVCLNQNQQFFWMTGSLSSVLDNAPTYVVFFQAAQASSQSQLAELKKAGNKEKVDAMEKMLAAAKEECGIPIPLKLLIAVSLGAVFMGSMTYIGNGPNFMVKAIAEESGVKMPSFFGYMGYSFVFLLPILIIMTFIFL